MDRTLEMTSDAPTNVGKHVTLKIGPNITFDGPTVCGCQHVYKQGFMPQFHNLLLIHLNVFLCVFISD